MKKTVSVIALLAALMLLLAGCGNTEPTDIPDGYQLASTEECDYNFYVPDTWIVDSDSLYSCAYYSAGDPTSISVTAYNMDYTDTTVSDWWEGYTEQMNKAFEEYTLVSEDDAKMGGIDGKKYTYTAKLADVQYNFVCTAVVKDAYVYYMLYTSTADKYEEHIDTLNEVIGYFEFE